MTWLIPADTLAAYTGAAIVLVLVPGMLWTRSGRRPAGVADTTSRVPARPRGLRLVGDGFLTGLLNPKVALFFLAFLPQFVHPERGHVVIQFLLLGGILALLDLLWAMILSAAVAHAHLRFTGPGRFAAWRDRVAGGVLVALGVKLAFTRR